MKKLFKVLQVAKYTCTDQPGPDLSPNISIFRIKVGGSRLIALHGCRHMDWEILFA